MTNLEEWNAKEADKTISARIVGLDLVFARAWKHNYIPQNYVSEGK